MHKRLTFCHIISREKLQWIKSLTCKFDEIILEIKRHKHRQSNEQTLEHIDNQQEKSPLTVPTIIVKSMGQLVTRNWTCRTICVWSANKYMQYASHCNEGGRVTGFSRLLLAYTYISYLSCFDHSTASISTPNWKCFYLAMMSDVRLCI